MGGRLGWPLSTILVGALVGYVVTALAGAVAGSGMLSGGAAELPEARQYMLGLLANDPQAATNVRSAQDVVSRAIELQSSSENQGRIVPITLTFVGGASQGRINVQVYAIEVSSGTQIRFFPLSLTLIEGKVVRAE